MSLPFISQDCVDAYFSELGRLPRATEVTLAEGVQTGLPAGIDAVIQWAMAAHEKDRKVMFIGNGGSAAIASHMAIDYWNNGGVRAMAFNDAPLLTCIANDYGYERIFEKTIAMLAKPGDLLIAISSSGRSPNILNGVQAARGRDCRVVTLSGFTPENPLRTKGDVNFYVPSTAYGFVEIVHLSICHAILDIACDRKRKAKE